MAKCYVGVLELQDYEKCKLQYVQMYVWSSCTLSIIKCNIKRVNSISIYIKEGTI